MNTRKLRIGIMGSSLDLDSKVESSAYFRARELGEEIAKRGQILISGAMTGLPHKVSLAARARGGLTVGVSPAMNEESRKPLFPPFAGQES